MDIIAMASGKGGTGKSTTAVYVGAALASMGEKVVLIELSAALRSVDIITGISEKVVFDIEDVLSGRVEPMRAVVESPLYQGLYVLSAPYIGDIINVSRLQELIAFLRPAFEYIILDVGYGSVFEAAMTVSNSLVMVVTPDPIALRDARTLLDASNNLPSHMRLLINRVSRHSVLRDGILKDLDEAIDTVGVQLLGVVPESVAVQKATARGDALSQLDIAWQVYVAIAKRIRGEDVPLVYQ